MWIPTEIGKKKKKGQQLFLLHFVFWYFIIRNMAINSKFGCIKQKLE